ncbi:MAG: hypothetical protein IPL15_24840 [Comamonadaceae bacterium]|uniref:hypothetical protein n=1 Tax=Candidatus Skiveiella danica TaxID=3386177 RepID=UPI00390A6881|nr:hypothetical protein [Comamonadaceae bacterium]
MTIELKPEEDALRTEIADLWGKASKALDDGRSAEDAVKLIEDAGTRSHRLHMLLKDRGIEPQHHAYMIKNRDMKPDAPDFYMHFHPIEDLLKFLEDENANDDPVDQTIGVEFSFRVFSRRWDHEDTYKVRRTHDGWDISHLAIGGPSDKGGQPFLFRNLRQDSIQFRQDWTGGWNGFGIRLQKRD